MALRHVGHRIAPGIFLALAFGIINSPSVLRAGDAAAAAGRPAVSLVADAERSRHFHAVVRHLELGGTMFGYVDVEGDMLALGGVASRIMETVADFQPQAAILQQDYAALFADLGLADVKAVGLSSVQLADGAFRNRVFLHTPVGRRGLLAGLGGPATPFQHLHLAPADADLYFEAEVDVPAIYAAVRGVIAKVVSEGMAQGIDSQLKAVGAKSGLSAYELIQRAKGRVAVVLVVDKEKSFTGPPPQEFVLPMFSLLVRLDGVGPALLRAFEENSELERSEEAGLVVFTPHEPSPVPGFTPRLVIEGDALFFATSSEFFASCRAQTTSLAQSPELQKIFAEFGAEGNGITFVSPAMLAQIGRVAELNAGSPALENPVLAMILANAGAPTFPLVSIRTNLPDGILYRSQWHSSLKQDVGLLAFYNPATVGLLAAVAIPTIGKVRESAQIASIRSNLRQLHQAATLYCQEESAESVTYEQLAASAIGSFVRELQPVAGENYRKLVITPGKPLRVRTSDGRQVEFSP